MRSLALLLSLSLFSLNGLTEVKELYATITDNVPSVGQEAEVYLGDRMLSQRTGQWKECITPQNDLQRTAMGGVRAVYKAGEPLCRESASYKKGRYIPNYVNYTQRGSVYNGSYPVRWTPKGNKSKLCVCIGICGACVKNLREDEVVSEIAFIYKPNSIQQIIEYTGRNENILTFTYSEFRDGYAREAFNREFQVDLDKGNVVAFKGAVLEVIEATNIEIRYKVIRNFQA